MLRRLYFLFPSRREAREAIDELEKHEQLHEDQFHALAREDVDINGLPAATPQQRQDMRARLAQWLWISDLGLFSIALLALVASLLFGHYLLSGIAFAIMLATFVVGAWYAIRVPDTSLKEFDSTLAHRELLLMVDVPQSQTGAIERRISQHYPAAVAGGSSWTVNHFGI